MMERRRILILGGMTAVLAAATAIWLVARPAKEVEAALCHPPHPVRLHQHP
jgi:hypothetical protein